MQTIENVDEMKRAIDFTTFGWKKLGAMDEDMIIELSRKLFIFAEFKRDGKEINKGETYTYTHIVDALNDSEDRHAFLLHVSWSVEDLTEDGLIDASKAHVIGIYKKGQTWERGYMPLKKVVQKLVRKFVPERYKEMVG